MVWPTSTPDDVKAVEAVISTVPQSFSELAEAALGSRSPSTQHRVSIALSVIAERYEIVSHFKARDVTGFRRRLCSLPAQAYSLSHRGHQQLAKDVGRRLV